MPAETFRSGRWTTLSSCRPMVISVTVEGNLPAVPLVVFDHQLHGSTRPLPGPGPMLQGAAA